MRVNVYVCKINYATAGSDIVSKRKCLLGITK